MDNTIYIGGIANMAEFQLKVEIILYTIRLQGQGLSIGQMIDDGSNG